MTSTTGTDEHPEVAEISALTEGILPPGRSADVRGHLEGCPLCADVQASLEEIRGLLGTLPGPPLMPADVAGRIDAALAAEALLTSTSAVRDVSRETDESAHTEDVSRETPLLPGLGLSPGPRDSRPAGHAGGPAGPGRSGGRRRRWRKGLLVSASAVAVLGLGGVLVASLETGGDGRSQASDAARTAEQDGLQSRVKALLAASSTVQKKTPGLSGGGAAPGNRPMFGTASTAPSCVLDGIGGSGQPLAAAPYKYHGIASYLVVLPHPSDGSRVDAYVVDASCTSASHGHAGKVLREETYTR